MNTYKKLVGSNLREFRNRRAFKSYEIAELIELNPGTYRNMESGKQLPTLEQLEVLTNLYKCTVEDLTWKSEWINVVENKETILNEYIAPIEKEISLRKNKARVEIERNILSSIIIEVEKYKDAAFSEFVEGEDYLEILDSVRAEIELRVKQLNNRHLKSKNPNEYKIGIAPNGVKYKYKDI
ncbi:MAG: helix-turn-helix domain-containing protein [Paraclostridium sp.]